MGFLKLIVQVFLVCFELTWMGGEGWGPEGWGAAQNFALFFFPVPPQNSFFYSLSGSLLVEFWWCLKRRDPQMCTFGISHDKHLRVPVFKTPPEFNEQDREKKERNFGRSRGRASKGRAVPGRAVPGRAVPGRAVPGRAVQGRAVQGRAVPGRAVPGHQHPHHTHTTHTNTHKHTQTHTNTHKHTQTHTNTHNTNTHNTNTHNTNTHNTNTHKYKRPNKQTNKQPNKVGPPTLRTPTFLHPPTSTQNTKKNPNN